MVAHSRFRPNTDINMMVPEHTGNMQLGVRYGERSVTRALNPSATAEKPQSVPAGTVERDQNLEEIEDVGALDEPD
jgi:hypothetical protein